TEIQTIILINIFFLIFYYYVTGCFCSNLQYLFRIPKQTLSTLIPKVLDALWE
ncbi:hypothetical protein X975_23027, partial [Stegodyphus mimosarum]